MKNTDAAANTVTDEQIEALRAEAASHGDWEMDMLCSRALTGPLSGPDALQAEARAECARVIAEAQAQADD